MNDVKTFHVLTVGGAALPEQTNAGAYAGGAVSPIPTPEPHLAPTAAGTVTTIVGALRVMLPPGDATDRLVLMVTGLQEQAMAEGAAPMRNCATCGEPFAWKHPAAIYCSDRCGTLARVRQYRQRRSKAGLTV